MTDRIEVVSRKKVHIRICTGNCKNHGGWDRPVYVYPQIRVCLFFWRTLWDCPCCQNEKNVERWVKEAYPNAILHRGGWRDL